MPADLDSPKALSDCALLFALPLCREDLDKAIGGEALADYGAQLSGWGQSADTIWTKTFAPIAAAGARLADSAVEQGAYVCRRAILADVSEATRRCGIAIVFAHQLSASYAPRHLCEPDAIVDRLAELSCPASRMVAFQKGADAAIVAQTLNRLIGANAAIDLLPEVVRAVARRSPVIARALCRDLIDQWLCGLVVPGNCIELHDGAHAPGRFAAALDPAFSGELDLSTCNSTVLTMAIELRFGLRVRLASRTTLTVPHPEFWLTAETLKLWTRNGGSYLDARRLVTEQAGKAIQLRGI